MMTQAMRRAGFLGAWLGGLVGVLALRTAVREPLAVCAGAHRYWVDVPPRGNDGAVGDSAHPWATLAHATSAMTIAGDTVTVEDGTYTTAGSTGLSISRSGTATCRMTYRAHHRLGATIDVCGHAIPCPDGGATVATVSASYITIDGFKMRGSWHDGIEQGSSYGYLWLQHNEIYEIGRVCSSGGEGHSAFTGYPSHLHIDANIVHDIGRLTDSTEAVARGDPDYVYGCHTSNQYYQNHDHGIYQANGSDIWLTNNIFYHLWHGWVVQLSAGSLVTNFNVIGNTFYDPNPWRTGYVINNNMTWDGGEISDNIFVNPTGAAVFYSGGTFTSATKGRRNVTGPTGTFNCPGQMDCSGGNLNATNPLLVNPAGLDFSLQAGSPAINYGINRATLGLDYAKRVRPVSTSSDAGALEYPVDTSFAYAIGDVNGSGTNALAQLMDTICVKSGSYGPCNQPTWQGGVKHLPYLLIMGDFCWSNGNMSDCKSSGSRARLQAKTTKRQWLPVPGNHDYNGTASYWNYMSNAGDTTPPRALAYGAQGKMWWSYNVGAYWHIIGINHYNDGQGMAIGSEQYNWLQADLAANVRPCVLALQHGNLWSDGSSHGDDATASRAWSLLVGAHADLILGGHDHIYERFPAAHTDLNTSHFWPDANGLVEIISGAGGNGNYSLKSKLDSIEGQPYTQAAAVVYGSSQLGGNFGLVRLVFGPGWWKWKFMPTGGSLADSGGPVTCHTK